MTEHTDSAKPDWRDSETVPDCPTITDGEPVKLIWHDSQGRRCTKWADATELGNLIERHASDAGETPNERYTRECVDAAGEHMRESVIAATAPASDGGELAKRCETYSRKIHELRGMKEQPSDDWINAVSLTLRQAAAALAEKTSLQDR